MKLLEAAVSEFAFVCRALPKQCKTEPPKQQFVVGLGPGSGMPFFFFLGGGGGGTYFPSQRPTRNLDNTARHQGEQQGPNCSMINHLQAV